MCVYAANESDVLLFPVSSSLQVVSSSVMAPPPPSSIITSSSTPLLSAPSTPAAKAPPLMAQAPPLILTQTANGTFLLPAAPGGGSAPSILLTAQVHKTNSPALWVGPQQPSSQQRIGSLRR